MGERPTHLREALRRLCQTEQLADISSVYETEPVGYQAQPCFLNLVCRMHTGLEASDLLGLVKNIELAMGRHSGFRNGPRVIDIDILFYDDVVVDTPSLTIPHPRLTERAFVLIPLTEIAPGLVHPTLHQPVSLLARRVDRSKKVRRISEGLDVSAICRGAL